MKKTLKRSFVLFLAATILASSMQIFGLTAFSLNVPDSPQNVQAASTSYNSIKVSWSPVNSADVYIIYRFDSDANVYVRIKATATTSFTNTGLTTGSTYSYKVSACQTVDGVNIYSKPSPEVSAIPIPSTPANFKLTSPTYNSVRLTWSAVTGATGYVVYRYNSETKVLERVKVTKSTACTNTGLTIGTKYYYKTRAYQAVNGSNVYGNPSKIPLSVTPRAFRLEDLNGKKVAVQAYTMSDDYLAELLAQGNIHFEILKYNRIDQCFDSLKSGKSDAVMTDDIAASYMAGIGKVAWRSDAGEPMGVFLKKGNNDLTALVESAMDTLYYDGTVAQIATKYFGSDITKGIRTVTVKPTLDLAKLKTIKAGTLKVGMEIGYPPMEYLAKDGVTYIGFDVELAQKIADLFGLKLEIVNTAWDGIFAALNKGEFDMIISAVTITNDRQANFNVTKPYIENHQVLVVNN